MKLPNRLVSKRKFFRSWFFRWVILLGSLFLFLGSYLGIRLSLGFLQSPRPQVILVLGGGVEREKFAAQFAQSHPTLSIWVSSGSNQAAKIFREASISDRVHLDCRATDTVTNFTSVINDLEQRGIHHVYLITSSKHMSRAKAIGTIVFGSRGVFMTPISVQDGTKFPEPRQRRLRDIGRSVLWAFTGHTGENFSRRNNLKACSIPGYEPGIIAQDEQAIPAPLFGAGTAAAILIAAVSLAVGLLYLAFRFLILPLLRTATQLFFPEPAARVCTNCGSEQLVRVHRKLFDRLISAASLPLGWKMHRYRCLQCSWTGLLAERR
jgi:uncharacterized SAM-binding protein YcdF (DUF218 family)